MCQATLKRLSNRFESCQAQKVASLLTEALRLKVLSIERVGCRMDVMRGFEERREGARLAGVENLMLHFTPYGEDWSKLTVIVSGEGCYVTDDKGNTYIDGLAGLFATQVGNGRTEIAEAAAGQMKDLGFFPNWSFQHPKSLELAEKLAQIAPGDLDTSFFLFSGSEGGETGIKLRSEERRVG